MSRTDPPLVMGHRCCVAMVVRDEEVREGRCHGDAHPTAGASGGVLAVWPDACGRRLVSRNGHHC